jgi:hypothetical protein
MSQSTSKVVALSVAQSSARASCVASGGIQTVYAVWLAKRLEYDALNDQILTYKDEAPKGAVEWRGKWLQTEKEIDTAVTGHPAEAITIARSHLKASLAASIADRARHVTSPDLAKWEKRLDRLGRDLVRHERELSVLPALSLEDVAAKVHVAVKNLAIRCGAEKCPAVALSVLADLRHLTPSIGFETLKMELRPEAWRALDKRSA